MQGPGLGGEQELGGTGSVVAGGRVDLLLLLQEGGVIGGEREIPLTVEARLAFVANLEGLVGSGGGGGGTSVLLPPTNEEGQDGDGA